MNSSNLLKLATVWILVFVKAQSAITFNLDRPQDYQKFVTEVRNVVADPKRRCHGLPIIKAPDPKNKYFYVQVNSPAQGHLLAISVALQFQTSDLYLVAYHDRDNLGNDRAFYFKGMIAPNDVFPHVRNIRRELTRCNHDYGSITKAADKNIKDLEFCLPNLEDAMRKAYGLILTDENFKQLQALFILYSIEMVAEAARFKYIEQKTVHKQRSDVEVASLVNVWSKLSVQIVRSKDGNFKTAIDIQVTPTRTWKVQTVDGIKPDMGILCYVEPTTGNAASSSSDEL